MNRLLDGLMDRRILLLITYQFFPVWLQHKPSLSMADGYISGITFAQLLRN